LGELPSADCAPCPVGPRAAAAGGRRFAGRDYELRAKQGHVQYRVLYFFHGRNVAILAHALMKEDKIPAVDIERALKRKREFERDPEGHTYAED